MPFHSFHYKNDQLHSHLDKILSQSLVSLWFRAGFIYHRNGDSQLIKPRNRLGVSKSTLQRGACGHALRPATELRVINCWFFKKKHVVMPYAELWHHRSRDWSRLSPSLSISVTRPRTNLHSLHSLCSDNSQWQVISGKNKPIPDKYLSWWSPT